MTWAAAHSGAKGKSQHVLITLASFANPKRDNGRWVAWPSISTIASQSGLCENTVRRAIRDLQDLDLLEVKRSEGGHAGSTNTYVMTPAPDEGVRGSPDEGVISSTPAFNEPTPAFNEGRGASNELTPAPDEGELIRTSNEPVIETGKSFSSKK